MQVRHAGRLWLLKSTSEWLWRSFPGTTSGVAKARGPSVQDKGKPGAGGVPAHASPRPLPGSATTNCAPSTAAQQFCSPAHVAPPCSTRHLRCGHPPLNDTLAVRGSPTRHARITVILTSIGQSRTMVQRLREAPRVTMPKRPCVCTARLILALSPSPSGAQPPDPRRRRRDAGRYLPGGPHCSQSYLSLDPSWGTTAASIAP